MGVVVDAGGTAEHQGEQADCSSKSSSGPLLDLEAAALGGAAPAPAAPRGARRRQAALLTGSVACVVGAEAWLLASPAVPWLLDKAFLLACLAFQAPMLVALLPGVPAACGSRLMDVCHWAFVLLVHAGVLLLRAPECVLLIGAVALATVTLRLCMRNRCLITLAAQRSSLPDIPGGAVTCVFAGLLALSALRLGLMAAFGRGFPIDQLAARLLAAGAPAPARP